MSLTGHKETSPRTLWPSGSYWSEEGLDETVSGAPGEAGEQVLMEALLCSRSSLHIKDSGLPGGKGCDAPLLRRKQMLRVIHTRGTGTRITHLTVLAGGRGDSDPGLADFPCVCTGMHSPVCTVYMCMHACVYTRV